MAKEAILNFFLLGIIKPYPTSYIGYKDALNALLQAGISDVDIIDVYKKHNIKLSFYTDDDSIIILQYIVKALYHFELWITLEYLLRNEHYIYTGGFYNHSKNSLTNQINIIKFINIIITYSDIDVIDIIIILCYYTQNDYIFVDNIINILRKTSPKIILLRKLLDEEKLFFNREIYSIIKEIYLEEQFYLSQRYIWICACLIK